MAPWISLAMMVLAGLGLVLRHDMLPVIGFDLGIASAAVGIAGLLMFAGRTDGLGQESGMGEAPTSLLDANNRLVGPLVVATLAVILFAGYTFSGAIISSVTGAGDKSTAVKTLVLTPRPRGRAALRLKRQSNGLFQARALVNGSATHLTIDTGAATVVLSAEDARRAGISVDTLSFTVPVKTSGGTVYTAPAQLERVFVGPLGAANVAALVAKPGRLEFSLLGMSFLKRLRSYDLQENHLTLEG